MGVGKTINAAAFKIGLIACGNKSGYKLYNGLANVTGRTVKIFNKNYAMEGIRTDIALKGYAIDPKKTLADMTPLECYVRIFKWHKKYGENERNETIKSKSEMFTQLSLPEALPPSGEATQAQIDLTFREVTAGLTSLSGDVYLGLRKVLPPPRYATQADIDFVFREVIGGLMEWAYCKSDEHGHSMSDYAKTALGKTYPKGFHDDACIQSSKASWLFQEFQKH